MMSERRNLARNPGNRIYLGTPTSRYYHIIIFIHILMICPLSPASYKSEPSVTSKLTESQRHMWSYVFQSYVKLLKICLEWLLLRTPRTPLFHLVSCESDVSCVPGLSHRVWVWTHWLCLETYSSLQLSCCDIHNLTMATMAWNSPHEKNEIAAFCLYNL